MIHGLAHALNLVSIKCMMIAQRKRLAWSWLATFGVVGIWLRGSSVTQGAADVAKMEIVYGSDGQSNNFKSSF